MIDTYKKIKCGKQSRFSMPFSLQMIKEASSNGIDWRFLHIIDLTSIIYSIRIDNAREVLKYERSKKLQERGIESITSATEKDFNEL